MSTVKDDYKHPATKNKEKVDSWNSNYQQLTEYYNKHRNLEVPFGNTNLRILAKWTVRQRQRHLAGTLPADKKLLLDKLNFRWTSTEDKYMAAWMERYERLVSYKEKHSGSTAVPQNYESDPELATWVANQRKLYNKNKVKPDRIELLNAIGFEWKLKNQSSTRNPTGSAGSKYDKKWDIMYKKLVEYYSKHSNCNVPYVYPDDPSLALWVGNQRRAYHHKFWDSNLQMKQYRIELLNNLNFQWNLLNNTNDNKQKQKKNKATLPSHVVKRNSTTVNENKRHNLDKGSQDDSEDSKQAILSTKIRKKQNNILDEPSSQGRRKRRRTTDDNGMTQNLRNKVETSYPLVKNNRVSLTDLKAEAAREARLSSSSSLQASPEDYLQGIEHNDKLHNTKKRQTNITNTMTYSKNEYQLQESMITTKRKTIIINNSVIDWSKQEFAEV